MRTDVKLLTIEDLCQELGVVYRDAGRRRGEIVAEIIRRIEVRDTIVADLLEDADGDTIEALGSHTKGRLVQAIYNYEGGPPIYRVDGERVR